MKMHRFKRILSLLLVAALLAGFCVPGVQAASSGLSWKETDRKVRIDQTDRLVQTHSEPAHQPGDPVRVSIVLEDKPTIQAGYSTRNIAKSPEAMAYNANLRAKQDTLARQISDRVLGGKKLDVAWNLTLAANLISATVPYGTIEAIAALEGVKAVVLENTYAPCVVEREDVAQPQMYASLGMTGSSLTWNSGYTGAGSRIAVIDTGTDTNHQSLDNGAYLYALQQNAKAAGLSYESYLAGLDLLDQQEIASVLSQLNIYEQDSSLTAAKLYLNEKLPFAVNYVDRSYRLVVGHESDSQGEHGSHVAGIAAANRFIPSGNGYADALETVVMAGTAPDAQLITMKVFGASGGPSDSDYLAAVEDAIYLGCDAVNLSLGTSMAGNSYNEYFSQLLAYFTQTDTVVVASAGNSYSWQDATLFGYLYNDDVNMDTVGAPGSYTNFFTVASVENDGGVGLAFRAAGHTAMYADGLYGYNNPLYTLDTSSDGSGTDYDFVFIDGLGYTEDYTGMDLSGKVVFCSRGTLNFGVKGGNAADLGAAATIIYNNDSSGIFGMDLTGYYYSNPCASISMEDAAAIRAAATARTTSGGTTYYTGKITILGSEVGYRANSEYYLMSDFSSWGVPGDLSLKPEITAPGGNIYSIWGTNAVTGGGTDRYELMSGTSMAAPAITGMAALVAQYLRETGLSETEGLSVRAMTQSLLMSTAEPLFEKDSGNYYSLLKQGAGLARVDLAVAADSYILVEGQSDGKVKAELGDDPNRTGVYEFSFDIHNISGEAKTYTLSADIFCQDVFEYQAGSGVFLLDTWTRNLPASATFTISGTPVASGSELSAYDLNNDGVTNAQDADYLLEYLVGNKGSVYGQADVNGDGTVNTYDAHVLLTRLNSTAGVTVPANGTVTVDVRLQLTASGRQLLEDNYPNGTYVEAFVYAESTPSKEGAAGTRHSIPVLAYYGNWSDPSMYDRGTLMELAYGTTDIAPYLYNEVGFYGNSLCIDYGDGNEYYYGGNPYLDDDTYLPERNAFNSKDGSSISSQVYSLIRNASEVYITIANAQTGEEYYRKSLGDFNSAFYFVNGGSWEETIREARINWRGLDAQGNPLSEGTQVEVTITAIPEYYRNDDGTYDLEELGKGVHMSTRFTIDNTAPKASAITQTSETTLSITAQDNRHVAAAVLMNAAGTNVLAYATPNQTVAGQTVTLELDLSNLHGQSFLLVVGDYAMNETVYEITLELPEIERDYFTAIDYETMDFVGVDAAGQVTHLVSTGLTDLARAAEYVGGYVFIVTEDNSLYVANDEDLSYTQRICQLDPDNALLITSFNDMAYNHADGKLYGQFYSQLNSQAYPYLCTIDMYNGTIEVICELPVDVNTMAIDTQGNFYSAGYNDSSLYTYTLADVTSADPDMTLVGQMGYYYSSALTSMAWDHNTGRLYWAFPNSLVQINPKTAEVTLLGYQEELLVGLYTRPEQDEGMFDPVNRVDRVDLNLAQTRVMKGYQVRLEASVWPWNASDRTVIWSSSNSAVAAVDQNGIVTGVSEGTATITATSKMDGTKAATCTVTVTAAPGKTLNGLVWDEDGEIWMSEFRTDKLPAYTKLSSSSLGNDLAAATRSQDGSIYAASLDLSTLKSNLYKLDPVTYAPTLIGPSTDAYMDLAPAPGQPGNSLMAVYGGNVLTVDASTGDYYSYYNMFSYNLVGIAYAGTQEYTDWGFDTLADWYFIIDRVGNVYLMAFLEQDGDYYYLEHDQLAPGGIYTTLDFEMDTPYFGSAYFDGEYLYYSAYKESHNNVTLMAIDVVGGSKTGYTLGTFDDGVWPVAGLMELDVTSLPDFLNTPNSAKPQTPDPDAQLSSLTLDEQEATAATGSLNSVVPQSSGEYQEQEEQVIVKLTGVDTAPNGKMTITYDPSALTFTGITGHTEAFAYKAENGKITVAFATDAELPADTTVATLTFKPVKPGTHTVTVSHTEAGNGTSSKKETLSVNIPAPEPEYTVKWASVSTTLTGNIGLNFYAELSENLRTASDAYIRFTLCGRTIDVPLSEGVSSVSNGVTRYRYTCPITAKNMTDTVTAQVMVGSTPVGQPKTMEVATYCNWIIANYKDAKTVNLMKAMLNYGASAQLLFNHNTGNLANAALSQADQALPNVDASAYKHSVTGSEDGIIAKSMTLLLDSETTIRVYFELTGSKSINDYTFYVNGKQATPVYKGGKYYVEIPNIPAHRLSQMQEVTVGGITVRYGALSYVNQVLNFAAATPETVNMAKALFVYYEAAKAYAS